MKTFVFIFLISTSAIPLMAQTYSARVSKDSLGVLNNRIEILKATIKILELKTEESAEESTVEKLRLKLLEANGNATSSAAKTSSQSDKTSSGSSFDLKAMDKLAKKAKSDANDAEKALERFNKQIAKVEDIRTQIQGEERKVGYKSPKVIFFYK
ncbi:MAG: hypothetical protein EOP55_15185 [Sphingobacteriales bacterium]|nr:MAG: hypothetical protein EOP55_15185 [Sphingobacteriales bacterium]